MFLVALLFVCQFFDICPAAEFTSLPFIFDTVAENPFKTKIFLNPAVSVALIKEISRRDVFHLKNNESLGIEEKLGEWVTLIANEAAPSVR